VLKSGIVLSQRSLDNIIMELPKITAPSIGSSPTQFLKEAKSELKKVKWPNKESVIKMTTIVIGVSVAVSLFISNLDLIFTKLMEAVIR